MENFDCHFIIPDTTSLSFYGEGGETLGKHGYSKDYRPDLKQMILGLVVDGSGTPICMDMWPGNTADVTAMSVVVLRGSRTYIGTYNALRFIGMEIQPKCQHRHVGGRAGGPGMRETA